MPDPLDRPEINEWYKMLAAACGVAFAAAIGVGAKDWAFVALGGLLFAVGVWKDHQTYSGVTPANYLMPALVRSKIIYKPTLIGALIVLVGIGLFAFGIYRVANADRIPATEQADVAT